MATQAFTPAQLASNIAFQTAKKTKPSVSTTPAPLQSLLKPKPQQSQAISTNNIPTTPQELPATGAKTVTQDDFKQKVIEAKKAGFTATQVLQKYRDKGYTIEGVDYNNFLEKEGKPIQEFAGGVAQSALETAKLGVTGVEAVAKADPLLSTITKGIELAGGEQLVQGARQLIQKGKEKVMQKLDAGKRIAGGTESPYYKGGKLLGDIAQTVLLPGPGGVTKGAGLLKGAGQLAKQGAIETAKFTAISEKRLPTPKELAYGVGGNLVLGGGGKLLGTLASKTKGVSSKIAEGIVGSNLKNPAMREKYIAKVGQTPEKTLLDEGIVGSLSSQAKQISEKSSTAYNATRDALKTMPTKVKSDEGLRITNKILEGVDETIPGIDEVIAPIKEMNKRFANGTATPMDLNDAKLMLARYENIYDQFGKVKTSGDEFEKKALAKMYNKMKTELEKIGEQYGVDLKSMNKETQKWEGLRALMDRAVAREAGRDMIGLSDYVLGGLTISDPMTAIPLALGKKFFSSPKVSSRIAKFLYSKGKNATSSASNTNMNVANRATKQGIIKTIKNNALKQKGNRAKPKVGLGKETLEQNVDDSLIQEAGKYKSADEFVNAVSDDLYALNKEAKKYKSSYSPTREKYNIKNTILRRFGKDTGERHKFSGGGIGRLYKLGNNTFHDITFDKSQYYIATDKKIRDAAKKIADIEGVDVSDISIYADPHMDYELRAFARDTSVKNWKEVGKILSDIHEYYKNTVKDISEIPLKEVSPPVENVKGIAYTDEVLNRLKQLSQSEMKLKQIREQANKKPLPLKKK